MTNKPPGPRIIIGFSVAAIKTVGKGKFEATVCVRTQDPDADPSLADMLVLLNKLLATGIVGWEGAHDCNPGNDS
jgi:hypothetical protein